MKLKTDFNLILWMFFLQECFTINARILPEVVKIVSPRNCATSVCQGLLITGFHLIANLFMTRLKTFGLSSLEINPRGSILFQPLSLYHQQYRDSNTGHFSSLIKNFSSLIDSEIQNFQISEQVTKSSIFLPNRSEKMTWPTWVETHLSECPYWAR